MVELNVEDAVVKYFQSEGYRCFPDKAKKRKKFSINDGKFWEPDVVAFRWEHDELALDIRAVECKDSGSYAGIMSARAQALTYQRHFPWCYIATPEPRDAVKSDVSFLRNLDHIGFIPVRKAKRVIPQEILEVFPKYLNYQLDTEVASMVRQRLVAYDCFIEKFGDKIIFGFEGDNMWISTDEAVQYHLNNFNTVRQFQFGLDIEKQPNVRASLRGNMLELQKQLKRATAFRDFIISFSWRIYSNKRPKVPMTISVMRKPCRHFTPLDAKNIEAKMANYDYQVHFLLQKTVWTEDEVLFRTEHLARLENAKKIIDKLRKDMSW